MAEYNRYYGLSGNPFDELTDARLFFSSETHNETLASLTYGIDQRKGFILILGEEGIGKTAVLQHLKRTLNDTVKTVYIDQGHTSFEHMLKDILAKLGLTLRKQTKGMMFHELYHFLIQCLERNENVVVIIDDAHKLSLETVEELRLTSNLETSKSKLLQIVLAGRPELNAKLSSEIIRQIKQRIVIRNILQPMTVSDTRQYIDHRLSMVGRSSQAIFSPEALALLCKYGEGNPRKINILCHNALAAGYFRAERVISEKTVRKVRHIKEQLTDEEAKSFKSSAVTFPPMKYVLVVLVLLAATGALYFLLNRHPSIPASFNSKLPVGNTVPKSADESAAKTGTVVSVSEVVSNNDSAAKPSKQVAAVASSSSATCDAKTEIGVKKTIIVRRGSSLSLLALQYYNEVNAMLIDYILELNPEITDLDLIQVNQKIKLPEISGLQFPIQSANNLCKIHVETMASANEALQYKHQAVLKGRVEIVPRKVSPRETWYRVLAGPFSSKDEADSFMLEMKKSGLISSLQRLTYSGR